MNRTLAGILEMRLGTEFKDFGVLWEPTGEGVGWFGGLHSPYRKCTKNKQFLFPKENYL